MSKAILVMDMPDNCRTCIFHYPARDMHTGEYFGSCRIIPTMAIRDSNIKPDWCPFKPLPEKDRKSYTDNSGITYKRGWNACIDAISKDE